MYFVHPQIKELKKVLFAFLKNEEKTLRAQLSFYFPGKNFYFFDLGRTAFKKIIEHYGLKGSEIIVPAFLCDIFYPIFKKYEILPQFVDVSLDTFQPEISEIKKKITPRTRAILICHTFGLPFNLEPLTSNFQFPTSNFQPLIIEDCAHALFAKVGESWCGNLGDVAFFSLYKQIPCVRGGLLVTKDKISENELTTTRFNLRDFISLLNSFSFFAFLFKTFGKEIAPKMAKKEKLEKIGKINSVSLGLFFQFFDYYKNTLPQRIEMAHYLKEKLERLGFLVQRSENNVFCYFSALIPKVFKEKRDEFVVLLRKEKVFCTRIWKEPIVLHPKVQKDYRIVPEQFPNTLEIAQRIVNFPLQNYFTKKDVDKIVFATEKTLRKLK